MKNALAPFEKIEHIEAMLSEFFQEQNPDTKSTPFEICKLTVSGEPGARCLTFQIATKEEYFESVKPTLEELVNQARASGFQVDELLQKVTEDPWKIRLWLLVYETEKHLSEEELLSKQNIHH
jgi:hypothetical protein